MQSINFFLHYLNIILAPFLTEVLVDGIEKRFAALQSQWHKTGVEALHVMRALHVVMNHASAGGAEGFNRVELVLLHSSRLTAFDYRHRFSGVYAIGRDGVTVQISN